MSTGKKRKKLFERRKLNKAWKDMTPQERHTFIYTSSASKLITFQTCHLKFYFTYVEPQRVSEWIRTLFGIAIHMMCHRFFMVNYKSKRSFLKFWYYLWQVEIKDVMPNDTIRWDTDNPDEEREAYFRRGMKVLSLFWEDNIDIRDSPLKPQTEVGFYFAFHEYMLRGFIDRRQPLAGGGIDLIDYKTGFGRYDEPQMIRDIQFTIYQLAEEVVRHEKPKALWIHRLGDNVHIPVPLRKKEHYELLHEYLLEAEATIKKLLYSTELPADIFRFHMSPGTVQRQIFLPRPGSHCNFCDFEKICYARQVEAIPAYRERMLSGELNRMLSRKADDPFEQFSIPLEYTGRKGDLHKNKTKVEKHKRKAKRGKAQLSWDF